MWIRSLAQVLSGKPQIEGIGCASCHLIDGRGTSTHPPPTYKVKPGEMLYGPYPDPEENLVHPATQSDIYKGANYCASCHFDKVKRCHPEGGAGGNTQRDGLSGLPHGALHREFHI